jgi:uncharacterized RDD family membrane protein YckC
VPLPARFCTACGSRLGSGDEPADEAPAEGALAPPAPDDAASMEQEQPAGPKTAPVPEPALAVEPAAPAEPEGEPPQEPPLEPSQDVTAPEASGEQASPLESLEPPPPPPDEDESAPKLHMRSAADEMREPPMVSLSRPEALRPEPRVMVEPVRMVAAASGPAAAPAQLSRPVVPVVAAPPPLVGLVEPWRPDARPAAPAPPVARAPLPAGALSRLGAAVVDTVIVGGGQALLSLPAFLYWLGSARSAGEPRADVPFMPILFSVSLAALAAILGAVYHVYFWGVKGATPGKRLFGLVVQRQDGRQPIGPGRAALRLLGYGVSGLVLGIGFLMIALGGSGLHDQIAGTRVVRRQGA